MASIKVDYEGIENDISKLATNAKAICDSLDKINDIEKIVPSSWQSPGAEQYRGVVGTDIMAPIANFESTLTGLVKMLSDISDNFGNLENIIGTELNNWFNGMMEDGKLLDFVVFSELLLHYDINYLTQDSSYESIPYSTNNLAKSGCLLLLLH